MKKSVLYSLSTLTLLGVLCYFPLNHVLQQQELGARLEQKLAQEQDRLDKERQLAQDKFYYHQLSSIEQKDYLRMVAGLREFSTNFTFDSLDSQSLSKVYAAVSFDYPEFYWLSEAKGEIDFSNYTYPLEVKETYTKLQELGNQVVSQVPAGSDYDKIKFLYDYIITTADYNKAALSNEELTWQNQSIRSVFLENSSVCAGYSRAFQFLAQKIGIKTVYVAGDIAAYDLPHAWNLVEIDGHYYPVDTTWGDPVFESEVGQNVSHTIDYSYLCMPRELFEETHTAWTGFHKADAGEFAYPELADKDLGYYVLNGGYFETYDRNQIASYVASKFEERQQITISMQFATREAYDQFLAELESDHSFIHDLSWKRFSYRGYQFTHNPSTHVFTIELLAN